MRDKIITIYIVFFFIAASISFTSSFAQPPKNPMKPGMLTDDSPYFEYLKNDNNNQNLIYYPAPPISGTIGYWIEQINESVVLKYIQDLVDFGPRVTESIACDNAGTYIYEEFENMGLSVRYQYWVSGSSNGKNVEATLEGEDPTSDKIFVVLGHYDSVSGSPGADDNGGGTTAALAAAEILSQYRFRHTIRFLAVDGEEQGLHGSSEYAEEAENNGDNIIAALNADMIGFAPNEGDDDYVKIYTNTASEWLYNYIENISFYYSTELDGLETIDDGYISNSDHASFVNHGYDATCYHEYNFNDYYHSSNDVIGYMNMDYDAKVTRLIVATLAELAEPILYEHDIIVKDLIVPSVIPHGETQIISATIRNGGNNSESNIIVDFFENDTVLDSITLPYLNKMDSTVVNFSWNPAHGTYNVSIKSQEIPDEGDITNNNVNAIVSVISAPSINVAPLSLSFIIPTESTDVDSINISNFASAEDNLDFSISYSGDLGGDWLSANPEDGIVAINDSLLVTINVNSTGLSKGNYEGSVIISSNDVNDPEVIVSVNLSVVFANDVGVISVNHPTGLQSTIPHTVNVTVENFGSDDQVGIPVNVTIYEGGVNGLIHLEDFSGDPVDWTVTSTSGTSWTWDGSQERMENTYSSSTVNSGYLDSPVIDCSGRTGTTLSFWHDWKGDYSSAQQDGYVLGSIDGGSTFPYTIDEFHLNDPPTEIAVKNYSIPWADNEENVMIRFDVYNDNNWHWYMDDFNMSAEFMGDAVYSADATIDLISYTTGFVEFTPDWDVSVGSVYGIIATTQLVGDQDTSNDDAIGSVTIYEDFDPPITSNLIDYPDPQIVDGWVNFTADVSDLSGVADVFINISGPSAFGRANVSMTLGLGGVYYYNSSGFSTAGDYSYTIWAVDSLGNGVTSSVHDFHISSDPVTIHSIPINTGWNLVGFCVDNYMAMSSDIAGDVRDCVSVISWDGGLQTYKPFIVGGPSEFDFPVTPGMGLFVDAGSDGTLMLSGDVPSVVSIDLFVGWNLIGWYHDSVTMASSIAGNISGCISVISWDGGLQTYKPFIVGGPSEFDFMVTPGMGLFVDVSEGSTWNGEG